MLGEPVTPRTDVYTGCLVLRELLLARPAFEEGLPELELLRAMAETELPPIESTRAGISPRLADAMRPPVMAGEHVQIRLIREGRAAGQGVGYLDDGTMVVVEQANEHVGETVEVRVTNVLQTSNGQLIFGLLSGDTPDEHLPAVGGAAS